jgi:hypothetical protein
MRKHLILQIVLFFTVFVANAQRSLDDPTLQGLYKFSDEYFRSDPFKGQFSSFLKHLINDPDISNKNILKKTDTSFYTFYGTYKTYNPFFFKPKRIEIFLQESSVGFSDTAQAVDTIFTYQLLAFLDDNKKGREELKKEFEKIHRQTKRKFYDTAFKEKIEGSQVKGAWHNYFVPYYTLAPVTVIWSELKDQNELVLNITLRFKTEINQVFPPMPMVRPVLIQPFYRP